MRAAVYARKSTVQTGVADDAKSVTRQISGAKTFIASKDWSLDDSHVYSDDGVSGALFADRQEFQRMLRDAQPGHSTRLCFTTLTASVAMRKRRWSR
jgi:DNA invertase Pin-like site-specific DNA recombinase